MAKAETPHCLILAAGMSRRFGSVKLAHRLPSGEPMLVATLRPYLELGLPVSVVLGPALEPLRKPLEALSVEIIASDQAELGMSQSIVLGVRQHAQAVGWLIGLGDMPYLKSNSVAAILTSFAHDKNRTTNLPRQSR